ncbi:MAG: hypothetical protein JWQ33_1854 [Ramlibacter sp.]|nr:hypothetical protein [Ramlibacter sp.]
MPRPVLAALLLSLAACSPTFNWREVRVEPTGLRAMLPCKPDKGSRTVPMAGRDTELHVLGCDTGGATFAVLSADIVDPLRTGEVLAQWKTATLANMHGVSSHERPFMPAGAMPLVQSLRVAASGARADNSKVESQATYFARGSRVFQAVVYADRMPAEAAETFFSGLRFE